MKASCRVPTTVRIQRLLVLALLWLPACASPAGPEVEREVTSTLESFYSAMKAGDATKAMTFIAPDAVFVESGRLETRAEYEKNHLPNDIAFERQVTGKRGQWQVKMEADTAWAIATTDFDGTFDGSPVSFISAQLAVLTRQDGRWLIRSVHWSSRRR
jgi:ketosteroid isomerase-like protein